MVVTHLNIGGLVALAFDPSGKYLLTVSHSGRGVFDTRSWQRVSRDHALAYPDDSGVVEGIGPIAGMRLIAFEIEYDSGTLNVNSPSGDYSLFYQQGMLTVRPTGGSITAVGR